MEAGFSPVSGVYRSLEPLLVQLASLYIKTNDTLPCFLAYTIGNVDVKFVLQLVPSDQKWLASMAEELNNAATFFSTFANVSNKNVATLGGQIGDKKATWQRWQFSDRIEKAKAVEKYKLKLSEKELKARTKVTTFIANQKSRQELEPPLGKFIDIAKVEPLHTCNNAWQHLFQQMLVIGMKLTNQEVITKADTFEDLPCTSSLTKFFTCLEQLLKSQAAQAHVT